METIWSFTNINRLCFKVVALSWLIRNWPHSFDIFKQFLTIEIETCVMTPLDLLFETLQYFDLDANYLNGEGHWDIWFERKMKKLSEENK